MNLKIPTIGMTEAEENPTMYPATSIQGGYVYPST